MVLFGALQSQCLMQFQIPQFDKSGISYYIVDLTLRQKTIPKIPFHQEQLVYKSNNITRSKCLVGNGIIEMPQEKNEKKKCVSWFDVWTML